MTFEFQTLHLIDKLQKAKVKAPHVNFVNVQRISIHRDTRSCIFQHPPSRITFNPILLGENPKLSFACGIKQKVWEKLTHPIVFEISLKTIFGRPVNIFRQEISPSDLQQTGWFEREIDLAKYSGRKISLIFTTSVPKSANADYCWSAWDDPKIEHEVQTITKKFSKSHPAHVILITTDALRADHLGAYGNTEIKTPNCDQLAEEGVLFSHARAQLPGTLGSYASLLLGQHSFVHSIHREWGSIAKGLPFLPGHMSNHGYKTIMLPSEQELSDPRTGITSLFDEYVPCLGDPMQDGSITTRFFLDLLECQNKNTFFWLQYFDTHPPATPPEPYHSMYYSGDPESEENRYRPEAVAMIKGTEALQDLTVSLPWLKQGKIDAMLLDKLDATASAFRELDMSEPDLAIHLKGLGPKAYKNLTHQQFADWLTTQVDRLKSGIVTPDLLAWLDEIQPMLQEINDDITSWLDGVVDFRYPVLQYKAAVSYFDSHIGRLISYLKQNSLYDQSLIILTSPHGEILDEYDIYFHHHALTESSLRVPLIIKPPQNGGSYKPGRKIEGIFDLIDLFPTIIDLLGLNSPEGIAGHSRALHIYDGSPIPVHDSFAINNAFSMVSVTRDKYKFIKTEKDHLNSEQWAWNKGDRALFDLRNSPAESKNIISERLDLAQDMEARLNQFIKNIPL